MNEQPEDVLVKNPILQKMMEKFFTEHFKDVQDTGEKMTGLNVELKQKLDKMRSLRDFNKEHVTIRNNNIIKSPSNTTVYVPALQKKLTPQQGVIHTINHECIPNDVDLFVELVRMEQHPQDAVRNMMDLEQAQQKADRAILEAEKFRANVEAPGRSNMIDQLLVRQSIEPNFDNHDNNLSTTGQILVNPQSSNNEKLIGNADKVFVNPRFVDNEQMVGNMEGISLPAQGQLDGTREAMNMLNIGSGVSDDDFFHLTCHIKPNLNHKIEQGELSWKNYCQRIDWEVEAVKKVGWNGSKEMVVHIWYQLKKIAKLVVSGDGNKPLGLMLPSIVVITLIGQRKYGSI